MHTPIYNPADDRRLAEAAKARAGELRGQAIRDAWDAAGDATQGALRAATRLAHSLARHVRQGNAAPGPGLNHGPNPATRR